MGSQELFPTPPQPPRDKKGYQYFPVSRSEETWGLGFLTAEDLQVVHTVALGPSSASLAAWNHARDRVVYACLFYGTRTVTSATRAAVSERQRFCAT